MSDLEAKNFFKVYLSIHSFQRMLIPITAVECSNELLPATITLRNREGRCWHVEVKKCDDRMYFEKGWRRFIDENSIEDRDILVFDYVGFSVFDVKVLRLDGNEKIVLQEHETENLLVEVGERWEVEEVVEEEEDDNEEEKEEEEATTNNEGTSSMQDEDEEFHPEKYVHHLNPYFVAGIRLKRKNELYVPFNVIKDYDLSLEDNEEVTFLDPYNRKSIGRVVKWKDGRTCIRGWRKFCNRNRVDLQRDKCICEFLLENEQEDGGGQKPKILQVHIIRGR